MRWNEFHITKQIGSQEYRTVGAKEKQNLETNIQKISTNWGQNDKNSKVNTWAQKVVEKKHKG